MEYLSLEIFNLEGTGSKYAMLPENTSITITDTSEIFASGDVWSYNFKLNIPANAHIFGSAADLHGARLHEQIDHRRARLWVMGTPMYLGYLKLGDEVEVDENGDVSITLESGQKTFREMIEGMNAREVSVGDVKIGIALNRKRVASMKAYGRIVFDYLEYQKDWVPLDSVDFDFSGENNNYAYIQRWPKLVMSQGWYVDHDGARTDIELKDIINVQEPYSPGHPFCNINICYQKREMQDGSEHKVRGYTLRLGHGEDTWSGGDGETRFNNSPNFFLLYWLERLFKDKNVVIQENQMEKVDGLRRVFLANLGCFYEEMDTNNDEDELAPETPARKRYGNLSFPITFIANGGASFFDQNADDEENKPKVRVDSLVIDGIRADRTPHYYFSDFHAEYTSQQSVTGYWAYATGDNYPDVAATEIINSTEAAFGVRFLFDRDFTQVRIVLLRNVFQNTDTQDIACEIIKDEKVENSKRGFVLTYGGDEDNTDYNYNDWSRIDDSKPYQDIVEKYVTSLNKTCYYTPNNGNAYRIKIDETEKLYYPVLVEVGGYNDAKDGNCEGEESTIETVTISAKPLIMNYINGDYAVFFNGDMKVPGADNPPMAASVKAANLDQTKEARVEYYNYDHDTASKRIKTLQAEYEELVRKANRSKKGSDFIGNRRLGMGGDSSVYNALAIQKKQELDAARAEESIHKQVANLGVSIKGEVYAIERLDIVLQDNYSYEGNDGTPFDKANIGLCFGMMRGSGPDSFVFYDTDQDEKEGNDYWDIISGTSLIDHPDTCDNWGRNWGDLDVYNNYREMPKVFSQLFPPRDEDYFLTLLSPCGVGLHEITDAKGKVYSILLREPVSPFADKEKFREFEKYIDTWNGLTQEQIMEKDSVGYAGWKDIIIEFDSSRERLNTLEWLRNYYESKGSIDAPPVIHNGVATRYGNFSLKLRAEKPNPNFNPELPETHYDPEHPAANTNPRFLPITDSSLQGRGLADQFYKEYSYWVRNARIVKRTVKIELAQLLAIDKTKRVTIGDITGFIRKIQYTISNKTGLGLATFEIMYI